jgi:two-component system, sensor histidine kinase and response regulator
MDIDNTLLKIYVEDNSVGIRHDNLEIVFEEFRQIHDDSRGRPHGSGVRLTIGRHIFDFHKRKIWAESNQEKGGKFIFSIPLAKYSDLEEGIKIT